MNGFLHPQLVRLSLHRASENLDKFFRHFEVGTFESHVFARAPVENETKINVYKSSLVVDQDVAVVSVLDLKNVAHYTVCGKRFDEIEPSLDEL